MFYSSTRRNIAKDSKPQKKKKKKKKKSYYIKNWAPSVFFRIPSEYLFIYSLSFPHDIHFVPDQTLRHQYVCANAGGTPNILTKTLDEFETSDSCFGPFSFYTLKRRLSASCDIEETAKRKTCDHGGNRTLILQCFCALVTVWTATVINKKINK